MRIIFNIIFGFIIGLSPLIIGAVLALPLLSAYPNWIGISLSMLIGLIALWVGTRIFIQIQYIGVIEFLSIVHASPDLDHLEPAENSRTKRRQPGEFVQLVNQQEQLFKKGTIRIFGQWFGKPYGNNLVLKSAEFDSELNLLTLNFNRSTKLEIYNPQHIFEASVFLKILKADRIKLSWIEIEKSKKSKVEYFREYSIENKKIVVTSNSKRRKRNYDVSLGKPALMIFG